MHNPQQHLPVSATQVQQHQFVTGNQMPTLPNIPEVGTLPRQEVVNLHMALVHTLQGLAPKSAIRTFMANLFSSNQYTNAGYSELLGAAIDYYTVLKRDNQADVQRCAQLILDAYVPKVVDEFAALLAFLTPQQQADLNSLRGLRQQIGEQVMQAHGGYPPQQPGGYPPQQPSGYPPQQNVGYPPQGHYPQQPGGYPPQQNVGYPPQGGGGYPPQHAGGYPPQAGGGYPPQGGGHPGGPDLRFGTGGYPPHGGGGRPTAAWGGGAPPAPAMGTRRPAGPGANSMLNQAGSNAPVQGGGSRRPTVGGVHNPHEVNPTTNEVPGAEMKHIEPENRQLGHWSAVHEIRPPAPPIDREVTFTSASYIPVRRIDQKIVTTEKDGRTQWGVVDLEEGFMDYNQHEQNQKMTTLARQTQVGPKVGRAAHWADVSVPNVVSADDPKDEEHSESFKADVAVILNEPVLAYSFSHGRSQALASAETLGVEYSPERVFEYYIDLMTPVGSAVAAEQIQKLRETEDLAHLVTVLTELASEMDSRLWYQIHDRLTAVFCRRMRGGIGFPADITSIVDDYEVIMGILKSKFSDPAVDTFKRNAFVTCLRALNLRESNSKTLVAESVSVTELPWTSQEIGLVMEAKYCMLSAAVNEQMAGAALALFERTNVKSRQMNRRFWVTADNVVIELHRGDMGQNTFLISKSELCC